MTEPNPPVDLRVRGRIDEKTTRLALRAVLSASHLFGLAAGVHLRNLRGMKDPLADLQARLQLAELQARLAWDAVESFPHVSPRSRRGSGPTSPPRTVSASST